MENTRTEDPNTEGPARRPRFRRARTLAIVVVALGALAAVVISSLAPADAATTPAKKAAPPSRSGSKGELPMTMVAGCVAKAGITSTKALEELTPAQRRALESCLASNGYSKTAMTAAKACAEQQGVSTSPSALAKLKPGQLDRLKQCVLSRLHLGSA